MAKKSALAAKPPRAKAAPVTTAAVPSLATGPAAAEQIVPMQGNIVNAGGLQLIWAGNDCTLVFSRPRPAVTASGAPAKAAMVEIVAIVQMSAASMKDALIIITDTIKKYEEKYGEIHTLFTKSRQAKKRSATKH